MFELMIEILAYLGAAFLIGLILGYLFWGWGRRRALAAARAEGASSVRTSVDGDLPLKTQLDGCQRERKRLEQALERSKNRIARMEAALEEAKSSDATAGAGDSPTNADAETEAPAEVEEAPEESAAKERPWMFPRDKDGPEAGNDEDTPDAGSLLRLRTGASASELAYPSQDSDQEKTFVAPATLLSEAPAETDDLKSIKGVGPVMEGVLNRKGVYLFKQIANFTASDIEWLDAAIDAFPGRVERDDWVGQAQEFYRQKYGQAHDASE